MRRSEFLKLGTLGALGLAMGGSGAAFAAEAVAPVGEDDIPPVAREFRGVWVATVENIDWPSSRTLSTEAQQAELRGIFDLARALGFNAIVFQVRPSCDAFYASELEPWSEYLTGRMGESPNPYYDPLEFAVTEAHRRGLELHAWFNPFRALHRSRSGTPALTHISQTRPDLAKNYGRYFWLDPGEREARAHSLRVILDVVARYDIDAVHFDDYFYPYKERYGSGLEIPFPDDGSWKKYLAARGPLQRDDWRRANIDGFVAAVAEAVKRVKPHVKFGISPFGIWQPGMPSGIRGMNAYAELYADSRKWLNDGLVDYLAPQLYWPINRPQQSYVKLLEWWLLQNRRGRHVWPGSAAYRVADGSPSAVTSGEIANQIAVARRLNRNGGNIHFSFRAFRRNRGGLADLMREDVYAQPALIPASPWIDAAVPPAPSLALAHDERTGRRIARWSPSELTPPFQWVASVKRGDVWETSVLPGETRAVELSPRVAAMAVWAVSRSGVEGRRAAMRTPMAG
jgi:uncharacterized lipoprotein YddW (UPF0748 family)